MPNTPRNAPAEVRAVVAEIRPEATGVVSVRLEPAAGDKMPAWEPGAHIDLVLGPDLERQYSLCGDPTDLRSWRIGVLREPASRGGSAHVHEKLVVGDEVLCRGPRNNFALDAAEEYLFIAGGIGITPILPMIRACAAERKPWRLVYGGRTEASMAFRTELDAHGDLVTVWPQDEKGLLDLGGLLATPSPGTQIYCCGPGALLDAVEERCATWPVGALHLERFRPKDGALDGENSTFEVVLDHSDISITVTADQTVAEAIEAAGVDVPTSCREGTCGTCETVVLEGDPDHRDSFLTAQEKASNEVMMVCCSRSHSDRLVLDL
ncbi:MULTISPECIES: PDR/VanB family oxidoreductase [Pseudonocardia]|uniref:Phenoxybenzoate dioxygenase subunit beta n=2 Tax=Pseudonocardia TaxID=1847 RepID=A0A1Y2MNP2_PSEAH|nr:MULTISPECIES: PDR/VanB family oxidoreductase [Pseudonocardia]OSY36287.1 Phenoxybenzoate dioxygenase subunit beta [Pseudonocardia autotrophica]TDN73092.1 ferredoxin-NADP reductase [Pseudonocardia autotrophica]BBG03812.1 ferredoxin [Pseudonocardia autotrophica]GEC26580.1 ferredoxin [Pseudonocardia saturnea]